MSDISKKGDMSAAAEGALASAGVDVDIDMVGEIRRFERRLPHRPEKVWRALTEARELAQWFPATIEGEREKGALLRFVFNDGQEPNAEGEITECEPPRVLAYTMGGETLRWELSPIPEGTLLVFTTEVRIASAPANDNAVIACRMAA
jgi:uncharacterized protein YndB with AHSA1/START domain